MIAREKSIPVFAASTPMSSHDRVELRADERRRHLVDRVTPRVFCAVSATIADDAVDARRGERLEVGLDPRPAAGVGAGDRDATWNHRPA